MTRIQSRQMEHILKSNLCARKSSGSYRCAAACLLSWGVVLCLALWQVWLTWRLREQDRSLAAQRSRERLEQVADLAVAQLTGTLVDWDLRVREIVTLPPPATGKSRLPDDGSVIVFAANSAKAYPKPLLFVPEFHSTPAGTPEALEPAEQIEYRDQRSNSRLRPCGP